MASSSMSVQLQKIPSSRSRWWSRLWRLVVLLVTLVAVGVVTIWALTPWMSRWGATDAEVTLSLPGDDLMPAANAQTTRAITIDAPPALVWPWLLQLGVDRGGMYSYDALENLFGLNVHSVNEIVPAYQTLAVGDFVRFTPPDWLMTEGPGFYVIALDPPRSMTACFGMSDEPIEECTSSTWQFVLVPQTDGSTRLLLRTRSVAGSTVGQAAGAIWQTIPFVMERKMLLGIQERAENLAAVSPAPASLCPDVTRPALLLTGQPGHENELTLAPFDGQASCTLTLDPAPSGGVQLAAGGAFYVVRDDAGTQTIWALGETGASDSLAFTHTSEVPGLSSFILSVDGQLLAYAAAEFASLDDTQHIRSSLYIASVDGTDMRPLVDVSSDDGRILQPVRISTDNTLLFYALMPTGYGGMWNGIHGRYDNLYRVAVAGGQAELLFDCAAASIPLCIGDVAPDGNAVAIADWAKGMVTVMDTDGNVLSIVTPPGRDYVGFPTFGPAGELAFISADFGAPDQPPLPEPGYVSVVSAPYIEMPATWLTRDGVARIWQWVDSDHLVLFLEGESVSPVQLLASDGTTQPLETYPIGVVR